MSFVYWVFEDEYCFVFPHNSGYVGISENPRQRWWNLRKTKNRPKAKLLVLYEGTRQECLKKEHELRPHPHIGWNIAHGRTKPSPLWWAYCTQRKNAANRKISFLLTYDEWFKIWNDSGHLTKRGRRSDQYCMARTGDVGPYMQGNVIIITNSENGRQQAQRMLAAGVHRLTQTSSHEERTRWARNGGRKSGEAWRRMTPEQRRALAARKVRRRRHGGATTTTT